MCGVTVSQQIEASEQFPANYTRHRPLHLTYRTLSPACHSPVQARDIGLHVAVINPHRGTHSLLTASDRAALRELLAADFEL